MPEITLRCACGQIQGRAENVDARVGNRLVCCCDDCQRFAHTLDRGAVVLDDYGGTDICQMPMAFIRIDEGEEKIACLRLSEKGLYRWYAGCCGTPIGNTLGPGMPFVGIIHSFMDSDLDRNAALGPVRAYVYTRSATRPVPAERRGNSLLALLRISWKLLLWKSRGLHRPSPFFGADGEPISEPKVLESR